MSRLPQEGEYLNSWLTAADAVEPLDCLGPPINHVALSQFSCRTKSSDAGLNPSCHLLVSRAPLETVRAVNTLPPVESTPAKCQGSSALKWVSNCDQRA